MNPYLNLAVLYYSFVNVIMIVIVLVFVDQVPRSNTSVIIEPSVMFQHIYYYWIEYHVMIYLVLLNWVSHFDISIIIESSVTF